MSEAILDVSSALARVKQGLIRPRVYLLGVELEGGWIDPENHTGLIHDGSVHVTLPTTWRAADGRTKRDVQFYQGELPSPPLPPGQMWDWLHAHWPTVSNDTCGMHVHVSFKMAGQYQRLIAPEVTTTLVQEFHRWASEKGLPAEHPIWARLRGESRYCQHKYFGDQQVARTRKAYGMDEDGHRYTVLNYCYKQHETMECRLLPMMASATEGIEAIQHLLSILTASLMVLTRKREAALHATTEDDRHPLIEQHEEYV